MRAFVLTSLAALFLAASPALAADCASLAHLALPDTTIETAAAIPAGLFLPPYGGPQPDLPAFCRVAGMLHPTPDSRIRFEVWLPEKEWNKKLSGTGNGGYAGTLSYRQMAGVLRRGYATAGTDTGHQGDALDASWAFHHPEKIIDFGYRALHLTTVNAKAIIRAYYGAPPARAYFDSCSDGGREALMEAQRYPEDYDGILAGAPANDWSHLLSSGIDVQNVILRDPAGYISSLKLPAITRAVLAACDETDGLKDGILNDPRQCHFDPATLLCRQGDDITCLTAPQVTTLKKIYAGGADSHGRQIFPGLMPGDEAHAWPDWITHEGPASSGYLQNYFRYMVEDDPRWEALNADIDRSLADADRVTAKALNATDPDLSRFAARGGKLILYHGWNDPAISPLHTIAYYQQVASTLGAEKAASFLRLYMVPGMDHCADGPGPNAFGQLGIPSATDSPFGAYTALEAWVEQGTAPDAILATKYNAAHKPEMTRPLCPYPEVATYDGTGDPKEPASFRCKAP
jgi:feruloyl esterase